MLVPFAQSADDHQRRNARALAAAGAALMVEEKDLTGRVLAEAIADLVADPARIAAMEDAARTARPAGRGGPRVADLLVGTRRLARV